MSKSANTEQQFSATQGINISPNFEEIEAKIANLSDLQIRLIIAEVLSAGDIPQDQKKM